MFLIDLKTPPTIAIDDKNKVYKVRENEDVTFTVKVTGNPEPDVEWSTSKKIIKPSPRVEKTFREEAASLTIRKVTDEDVGEYTIKVTNPSGEAEAFLTLVILSKIFISPSAIPIITTTTIIILYLQNLHPPPVSQSR